MIARTWPYVELVSKNGRNFTVAIQHIVTITTAMEPDKEDPKHMVYTDSFSMIMLRDDRSPIVQGSVAEVTAKIDEAYESVVAHCAEVGAIKATQISQELIKKLENDEEI